MAVAANPPGPLFPVFQGLPCEMDSVANTAAAAVLSACLVWQLSWCIMACLSCACDCELQVDRERGGGLSVVAWRGGLYMRRHTCLLTSAGCERDVNAVSERWLCRAGGTQRGCNNTV